MSLDSSFVTILEFKGRPGEITNETIARIEGNFVTAYNQLEGIALGVRPPPFTRRLTTVEIDLGSISTDNNILINDMDTQTIRMVCRVAFECEGCDSELRLFSNITKEEGYNFFTFDPWFGPPPLVFTLFYNSIVAPSNPTPALDTLLSVQQLENVECAVDDVDIFYTDAVVDFVGDPSRASLVELIALANSFQNTYNGLNGIASDTCDPLFREIVEVFVDPGNSFMLQGDENDDPTRRHRHLQTASNFSQLAFNFIFRIGFKCLRCPRDKAPLFTNDGDRRRRLSSSSMEFEPHSSMMEVQHQASMATVSWTMPRFLEEEPSNPLLIDIDTTCACPVDATVFAAPTAEAFSVAYNDSIAELSAQGQVDFVTSVEQVQELQAIACNSTIVEDDTMVLLRVTGDPFSILAADRQALQLELVAAYNALAASTCDPFFRLMTLAELVDIGSADANEDGSFALTFQVFYECRGCPMDSAVLGTAARRLSDASSSTSTTTARRFLQNTNDDDTCYCAADATEFNAPSSSDLAILMDIVVMELNISSVTNVLGIAEEQCPLNQEDCDGDATNGCETNLMTSLQHCGQCGTTVGSFETCLNGQVRCDMMPFDNMVRNGNLEDGYPRQLTLEEGCGIRLTNDVAVARASSIFQTIDPSDLNADFSFSLYAAYRMFGDDAGQADGIAIVVHQDERGATALGGPGGGMGYQGIAPALIVELDTFNNADVNDDSDTHVHVQLSTTNDMLMEVAELEVVNSETIRTNGTTPGGVWIDYDGSSGVLSIYINSRSAFEKPTTPTLATTNNNEPLDLSALLDPTAPVSVGFTAGTLNQGDNQDIMTWSFSTTNDESS